MLKQPKIKYFIFGIIYFVIDVEFSKCVQLLSRVVIKKIT